MYRGGINSCFKTTALPGPLFTCRQLVFVGRFGGFAAMERNVCIEGRELLLYRRRVPQIGVSIFFLGGGVMKHPRLRS